MTVTVPIVWAQLITKPLYYKVTEHKE